MRWLGELVGRVDKLWQEQQASRMVVGRAGRGGKLVTVSKCARRGLVQVSLAGCYKARGRSSCVIQHGSSVCMHGSLASRWATVDGDFCVQSFMLAGAWGLAMVHWTQDKGTLE